MPGLDLGTFCMLQGKGRAHGKEEGTMGGEMGGNMGGREDGREGGREDGYERKSNSCVCVCMYTITSVL